jgi:3'(2'), 5'-bisphosphate nucleotidase
MRDLEQRALLGIARLAGQAILETVREGFSVEEKADHSPLTTADARSCRVILDGLAHAFPGVPVLCEETTSAPYATRRAWKRLFVVDPLDGTKEFVRGSGEYCVCLALVERGRPVYGVIHAPVTDTLYGGGPGLGAFRRVGDAPAEPIRVAPPRPGETLIVLGSVSHPDPGMDACLSRLPGHRLLSRGSALKFCALAEGAAHLYPRLNATWEWDIAAGHALLLGAGGSLTGPGNTPFTYNKPDLRNGPFLARAWKGCEPYPELLSFP